LTLVLSTIRTISSHKIERDLFTKEIPEFHWNFWQTINGCLTIIFSSFFLCYAIQWNQILPPVLSIFDLFCYFK
jgi:hypothetical protein